jgi:phage terminase small subunit
MRDRLPSKQVVEAAGTGPLMTALSPRRRAFVEALFQIKPGHGAPVEAARLAGYAAGTPEIASASAWRLMADPAIKAATVELSTQLFAMRGPEAVAAFSAILKDPEHKAHGKVVLAYFDRVAPVETKQNIHVTHETIDHTSAIIADIQAWRDMGASEQKLIETYGAAGLARYDALARSRAAEAAKVIDAEFETVEPAEPEPAGEIQW